MASTYNSSNPSTPNDKARLLLGDTGVDGSVFLLTDEEIAAFVGSLPFNEGVAQLAMGLATRFAQYPDETTTPGGTKTKWSERIATWKALAKDLRESPDAIALGGTRRRMGYLGNLSHPAEPSTGVRGLRP